MPNIAVLYATKTNHSRQYAEVVARVLETQARSVAEHPVYANIDLLFIAGGIYANHSLPELTTYLKTISAQQIGAVALLSNSAGVKQAQTDVREILKQKGIPILGEILLPGRFLFLRWGHPNPHDLQKAAQFALDMQKKLS